MGAIGNLLSTPVFIGAGILVFCCAMIWPERARLALSLIVSVVRHIVKIIRGKDDQAPAARRTSHPDLAGTISQPIKLPDHVPSIPKHRRREHHTHDAGHHTGHETGREP
jgi:hypothetical protein